MVGMMGIIDLLANDMTLFTDLLAMTLPMEQLTYVARYGKQN